jgi:hypothetical protein
MQKLLSIVLAAAAPLTLSALNASAAPLELSSLGAGTGHAPPPFSARPFFISGAQLAPGLQVVNTERFVHRELAGYHEYGVFADPARARAYETELKQGTETPFARSDSCFATVSNFNAPEQSNGRPVEWDTFSADRFTLQTFPGDGSPKVVPLRVERWREVDGKVRVETSEFWADTRTGGTRLIARTENELTRVAAPFAGVAVYAFRSGPKALSFFVRRDAPRNPATPNDDPLARLGFVQLTRGKGSAFDLRAFHTTLGAETHANPCAFEHVELETRADPPAEEPPEEAKARRLRQRLGKGPVVPSAAPLREVANVVLAVVVGLDTEPILAASPDAVSAALNGFRTTVQVRTMVVNLGLARAPSAEAPPEASISYRWLDRPRSLSF